MPREIRADESAGCVFVRYSGTVTAEEIVGVIAELFEVATHRALLRRVHDFRGVDGSLLTDELRRIADFGRQTRSQLTADERLSRRAAVLLPGDLAFGLGRMVEAFITDLNATPGPDFRVFRSFGEAASWLELPPEFADPFP